MHNSLSFKQVSQTKPTNIMIHGFNKFLMLLGNAILANPRQQQGPFWQIIHSQTNVLSLCNTSMEARQSSSNLQ
jgi:hypothetical protein